MTVLNPEVSALWRERATNAYRNKLNMPGGVANNIADRGYTRSCINNISAMHEITVDIAGALLTDTWGNAAFHNVNPPCVQESLGICRVPISSDVCFDLHTTLWI